jgi:hypothetical protein
MGTIMEALNRHEEEFAIAKQLILPEEDRVKYTSANGWVGFGDFGPQMLSA